MSLRSKVGKSASKAAAPPHPTVARAVRTRAEAGAKAIPTPIAKRGPRPAAEPQTKASPSMIKARRIVFGVGIFAIAVSGSIYGAGLKIKKDMSTKKEVWKQTTPEVQIMQLQVVRKKYERMANDLRAKLEVVERRIKDNNTEGP